MTGCEFGDLILVPFPFTDQSASKRRPAAVVSSETYHREHGDVIILAVTSRARRGDEDTDVTITGWQEAGLLRPSVFKPVLATLDRSLVLRRLGRLIESDRLALSTLLNRILGS
jgi:mRNA interferase MazF